ncbi:MAG TPA: DoxX family protein [Pseudomonadota bacterium]|nr:DoxX family protein [Pseudomonadota bacterium]
MSSSALPGTGHEAGASGNSLPTGRGLHIALWVAQGLLAAAFLAAGQGKIFMSADELAQRIPWVAQTGTGLVRFIGVSEWAGAFGLILPSVTRIAPKLTSVAALGLALVMLLAAGFHILRGEAQFVPVNLILGGIAGFIAWGRLRGAPIPSR